MFSVRSIFLPISVGLLFTVVVRLTDGQGLPQNVPPLSTEVNFNGANFDGLNVQTPATNQQNQTADSGQNKAKSGPPIPDATTISNVTRQDLKKMASHEPPTCSSMTVCSATAPCDPPCRCTTQNFLSKGRCIGALA